jgi:hypothetical protein
MFRKRPIEVFYIPKQKPQRNISQNSTRQLVSSNGRVLSTSPSFAYIDELQPPGSAPNSPIGQLSDTPNLSNKERSLVSSKISSRDSFLSKTSLEDDETKKKANKKRLLILFGALFIAACLIAVVVLLAINLSKSNTFRNDIII